MIRAAVLVLAVLASSCGPYPSSSAGPNLAQQMLAEPASNWPTYTITRKQVITHISTEFVLEKLGGAVTRDERQAVDDEIRRCMDELWRQQGPSNTVNDLATLCANGYLLSRRMR